MAQKLVLNGSGQRVEGLTALLALASPIVGVT
jgi:hypothetical protein